MQKKQRQKTQRYREQLRTWQEIVERVGDLSLRALSVALVRELELRTDRFAVMEVTGQVDLPGPEDVDDGLGVYAEFRHNAFGEPRDPDPTATTEAMLRRHGGHSGMMDRSDGTSR